MRVKSYFAATVEAAMNTARLELGADAMLVSTRRTDENTRHLGEYEVVFGSTAYPENRSIDSQGYAANQTLPAKAPQVDKLSEEVAGLKHEMERLASALARSTAGIAKIASNANLAEAFSRLVDTELDADLAQDIISRITAQVDQVSSLTASDCASFIGAELSRLVTADSRMPATPTRSAIVLVGPPGSGKTTTLVKLAVLYGLGTRRPSHILSLDAHRVAATEQLRSYASITGLGFQILETPRALSQALEEHRSKELVFIDTPGLSRDDFEEVTDMARAITRHPRIETHLVLSASMRPADMKRIAMQYEIFSPSKLIFTHLDETETFGAPLSLSIKTGKPISFLSRGQQIPEDLEAAEVRTLVELAGKDAARNELRSTVAA